MAVACKVKKDNAVIFGKIRQLGAPVTRIAAPDVHEDESRLSIAIDLIRNRNAVFGLNHMGPIRLSL